MPALRYNKDLLKIVCERDKCYVDFTQNQYNVLNRDTRITFICGSENCLQNGDKTFGQMDKKGGFCTVCMKKKKKAKIINTNQIRFGKDYPAQNAEILQKIKNTNQTRYGSDNPAKNATVQKKRKKTNKIRYGKDHPLQNAKVLEKMRNTNQARYKTDYALQNTEVKQKAKNTNRKRYKTEHPSQNFDIKQKRKATCQERYGEDHPSKNAKVQKKIKETLQKPEVKKKMIDTNQFRYGVDFTLQNAEVSSKAIKNAYKSKPFTFPCGNVIQVQGYEPFALELLIQQGKKYKDITTERTQVPEIWYETDDGKKHRYFCDILLDHDDKIIEVKSNWTLEKGKDIIPLKAQACVDAGFEYELWIFDEKKKLTVQTYEKPVLLFTEMLLSL